MSDIFTNGCSRKTTTHLSVRQHRGIVALQGALDQPLHARIVHLRLVRVHIEDVIEGERLVDAEHDLRLTRRHMCAHAAGVDQLAWNLRSDTQRHPHRGIHFVLGHDGACEVCLCVSEN